ncbi:MAG: proteasome assembly chaperone family protein [Candidatus Poseidoniales archaeon]|jgi:uncharacterized protein|nr:hypothetical protein [Euryarchaeota archaeon]MCH2641640.1 PAC2 family protein [Candidatus Thalassarchaeum sp.]GIS44995.1 MAG: proteasome assembly chaperone family protein [Candidatus Poseidoniales archaeon]|tara:strand:+ start:2371 stop:3168 length:798 start_codon:yes stop_codon:yes gene_type:complete
MGDLPRVKVSDGAITEGALVVSCFPSVSHVSSIVAHYLIERLELKFVGGVVDSRLPPVALIHEGKPMPPVRMYAGKPVCNMDQCDSIVVLVSEAPVPQKMMLPLAEALLEYSHQKGFNAGVLVDSYSHQQESGHEVMDSDDSNETLLGIGATDWAIEQLKEMDIALLEAGMIAGMSGVLLGEGRRRKLNMMCIMAEATGGIPDARAAARVIEKLNKLLPAMELDTEPLLEEAERIESQIKAMMEHQLGTAGDEHEDDGPNAMLYG